jgi:predicted transposase YdaD
MKKKKPVHNPHDALFKAAMTDPMVYREFFQAFLPPEVLKRTDLSRIQATQDHFISQELRQFYSDCLYTAPFDGENGYFYVLIEHQSSPDPKMPYRIWRYMFLIWEKIVRNENPDRIPFIQPLILYSGAQPYKYTTDLKKIIAGPIELVNQLFEEPIPLISLRDTPDEALKKHLHLAVFMLSLKHAFDELPIQEILELVARIDPGKVPKDRLLVLCHYWMEVSENLDIDRMIQWTHTSNQKDLEDMIMTTAEKLRQEGRTEGRMEGRMEGRSEGLMEGRMEEKSQVAINLLKLGTDPRIVANATDLPLARIKELEAETRTKGN